MLFLTDLLAFRRRPSARAFERLVAGLLLAATLTCSAGARAEPAPPTEPAELLDSARKEMEAVRAAPSDDLDDTQLLDLRRRALAAQAQADEAAAAMAPALADVKARLAELGAPVAGVKESPDIAQQRAALTKSQSTLDSQEKLARLLSVEAEQSATTLSAQRRAQFGARLGERTHSVLGTPFWSELAGDLPGDLVRVGRFATELRTASAAVPARTWLTVAAAIAFLLLLRFGLQRVLLHLTSTRVPPGRLRRSLHAVGVMLVWMVTPGLMAHALFLGLTTGGRLSPALGGLLGSVDAIVWFGGFVAGLGTALLMPGKPSWRLPPLSDALALRLRWFPPVLAVLVVLGAAAARLSSVSDTSLATTVALNCAVALALGLCLAGALASIGRTRREEKAAQPETPPKPAPIWLPLLNPVGWGVLVLTLLAVLAGYVAAGSFVISQLVWATVVSSAAYLLAVLADDLFMTLLAPTAQPAPPGTKGVAPEAGTPPHRTREQTAVLLSGVCRIAIVLLALMLLAAPYGEGPLELMRRAGRINEGIAIGEIAIRPAALLQAGLVLVLGLFGVRMLKGWLGDRYMPTTRMDAGMRLSVTTLFGYVGAVAVIALSMSAVGVGLERVAWVASALSVGIGFGLQAVVQNFVSGLILLAERPVKVGDWVSLSGVEGDIRRINVRATEIQMGDRSTVIVPNSEFITKIVRNVTHTDPIGLVQIKLPMPLSTDTAKARALLLEAFTAHPGVLETPAPNVQLDGIEGGNLIFNATGFASSPRASYGVKSDLLFDVLDRLRNAGLPLAVPATVLWSPAPQPEAAPAGPASPVTAAPGPAAA